MTKENAESKREPTPETKNMVNVFLSLFGPKFLKGFK